MFRRCYHVSCAFNYPRAVSKVKNSPASSVDFLKSISFEDNRLPRAEEIVESSKSPSELYVPISKQIFSNITKSSPLKNVVEVGPTPSVEIAPRNNDKAFGRNIVNGEVVVQNAESTSLRRHINDESTLPAPQFAADRMEHYRSKVPQRIMKLKFEQDDAEKEFQEAQTLFELQTALKVNLPIMDHINFLDALTAFDRLVSVVPDGDQLHRRLFKYRDAPLAPTFFTRDEILNLAEFVVVVKGLVKYCRDFTADEGFEVTTKLMNLKLPVDSLPLLVFLELMKTHVNKLTLNQLVELFKGLSIAADSAARNAEAGVEGASGTLPSALTKLTATLMGTETLILLRFPEEQSWLSCAEIVDLVTFVRGSELTKEMYRRALTLLITNAGELMPHSIVQYCRWLRAQDRNSVIREEELEALHEAMFDIFVDILLEDTGVNEQFFSKRGRDVTFCDLLSAMVEACSVSACLKVESALEVDAGPVSFPFCHASYEVSRLMGIVDLNQKNLSVD